MLTKKTIIGIVSILPERQMEVREDTFVYEDDVELSKTYFRYVLSPGDDISDRKQFLKDLANFLWTPEVIDAYKRKLELLKLSLPNIASGLNDGNRGTIREQGKTPPGIPKGDDTDRGNG